MELRCALFVLVMVEKTKLKLMAVTCKKIIIYFLAIVAYVKFSEHCLRGKFVNCVIVVFSSLSLKIIEIFSKYSLDRTLVSQVLLGGDYTDLSRFSECHRHLDILVV